MRIGFVLTDDVSESEFTGAERLLSRVGHEIGCVFKCGKNDFEAALPFIQNSCDAVGFCGDLTGFYDWLKNRFETFEKQCVFELEGMLYAVSEKLDNRFVEDTVIPMLNGRSKTFYTSCVFKTFGKTKDELKDRLKDFIKNKNRIAFSFYPLHGECEIDMRFSNKTAKDSVEEMIRGVTETLADCLYACKDASLQMQVVDLLKVRGKRLCVAESFTGGMIASILTRIAGVSEVFKEGIVCYSNSSKIARLGVEPGIIDTYGAVSIETAYEMAAGLLMQKNCDVCIATTGNAGPTAEKEGDIGLCFIAVGDVQGIHIYKYHFNGSRQEVMESGAKHALFHLYQLLKKNEFEELLKREQEKLKDKEVSSQE